MPPTTHGGDRPRTDTEDNAPSLLCVYNHLMTPIRLGVGLPRASSREPDWLWRATAIGQARHE